MVGDSAHTNEVLSVVSLLKHIPAPPNPATPDPPQCRPCKCIAINPLPGYWLPAVHEGRKDNKQGTTQYCGVTAVLVSATCDLLGIEMQIAVQDFHASDGNKLLSAGMDHSIKIWNLSGVHHNLTTLTPTPPLPLPWPLPLPLSLPYPALTLIPTFAIAPTLTTTPTHTPTTIPIPTEC